MLDVRSPYEFAAGHVAGALNVPVSGPSFGTKAGFLLDAERPVAIHASSREEADTAAARLRAVGLLDLAGFLTAPAATERMEPIELDELERLLADGRGRGDRRPREERARRRLHPRAAATSRTGWCGAYADELANGKTVVTVCESGARAGVAASVLAAHGIEARPAPRRRHPGLAGARQRRHHLPPLRRLVRDRLDAPRLQTDAGQARAS